MKDVFNLLLILLGATIFTNCADAKNEELAENSKLWEFISETEMPVGSTNNQSDAFITKYIRYRERGNSSDNYILMEGWENGWGFYFWRNKKWVSFSKSNSLSATTTHAYAKAITLYDLDAHACCACLPPLRNMIM